MDDMALYDEFGNYVGPELHEVVLMYFITRMNKWMMKRSKSSRSR